MLWWKKLDIKPFKSEPITTIEVDYSFAGNYEHQQSCF
jgi:hypothetical protein